MEILKRKNQQNAIQFIDVIKRNERDGITWFLHRSSIRRLMHDNVGRRTSDIFRKGSVFGLDGYQIWECNFKQMCCAKC